MLQKLRTHQIQGFRSIYATLGQLDLSSQSRIASICKVDAIKIRLVSQGIAIDFSAESDE
jgi:hypothetical protein